MKFSNPNFENLSSLKCAESRFLVDFFPISKWRFVFVDTSESLEKVSEEISVGNRIDIGPESTLKKVFRRFETDDVMGEIDDVIAVELLTSSTKFPE